jgi:hypothetical protein
VDEKMGKMGFFCFVFSTFFTHMDTDIDVDIDNKIKIYINKAIDSDRAIGWDR